MRKILGIFWHHKILFIFLIIVAGLMIFYSLPKNDTTVETQKVKRQDIAQSVITSGKIDSETSLKLNFLIPGKLVYVGAKKGDFVKKWQTIAALDTRSVQKNIEQDLRDYLRQRYIFDDILKANKNLTPELALSDSMKRLLQNNQFDLDKSVNSVELQAIVKEQSYLISPIDGIVLQADNLLTGVNISTANVFIVSDPKNVVFKIEVDEADIGKIKIGIPAKITLESFPDDPIHLNITKIDFASHTSANGGNVFNAEVKLPDNSDYKYKIGMTGDAEIIMSEKNKTLTVPLGSIFDGKYVYVKNNTGFAKREVKLGIQSDTDREVLSGLSDSEEVAIVPDNVEALQKNTKKYFFF